MVSAAPKMVTFFYSWQLRKRHHFGAARTFFGPSYFVKALCTYIDQNSVRKNTFKDPLEIALMIDFLFRALYKVQRPAGKSDVN